MAMKLDKLTPLELHHLLYDVLEKLEKLPCVYDEKKKKIMLHTTVIL